MLLLGDLGASFGGPLFCCCGEDCGALEFFHDDKVESLGCGVVG